MLTYVFQSAVGSFGTGVEVTSGAEGDLGVAACLEIKNPIPPAMVAIKIGRIIKSGSLGVGLG